MYMLSARLDTFHSAQPQLDPETLELKNHAIELRRSGNAQKKASDELLATVKAHILDARHSIYRLDLLGQQLQTATQLLVVTVGPGNAEAAKEAAVLVGEAAALRVSLGKGVAEVEKKRAQLAGLDLGARNAEVVKDVEVAERATQAVNEEVDGIIGRERDTFDGVSRYTEKVAETLAVVNDRVGKIEAIEAVRECFWCGRRFCFWGY